MGGEDGAASRLLGGDHSAAWLDDGARAHPRGPAAALRGCAGDLFVGWFLGEEG